MTGNVVGLQPWLGVWNREDREIEVLATGRRTLLGTLLLGTYELSIQFADGGIVSVEPI